MSNPKFVRNEVTYITNEIDYDKLAEAIVKANQTFVDKKEETEQPKKKSFWKSVWQIIRGKNDTNGDLTLFTFSSVVSILFNVLAIIGVLIILALIYTIVNYIIFLINSPPADISEWVKHIESIAFFVVLVFLAFTFSLLFRGAANEMDKEKDKNFVIAVFSGVVSFAALIVALVPLFK